MRVLVHGAAGRMGSHVMRLAAEGFAGAALAGGVDAFANGQPGVVAAFAQAAPCDVIVDFSHHSAVAAVLEYAVANKLPAVIATTGCTEEEKLAIAEAAKQVPVFFSANMSVGVALLCRMAAQTAALFPDADVEIVETHHNRKLDAPSGTALMIADNIKAARPQAVYNCGRSGMAKRQKNEIGIAAIRRGNIPGIHEVIVSTDTQAITLKHEVYDRAFFAEGALTAAAWLVDQPAGLYDMFSMLG